MGSKIIRNPGIVTGENVHYLFNSKISMKERDILILVMFGKK